MLHCTVSVIIHSPHKKSHCRTRCFSVLTIDFHPQQELLVHWHYGFTGQELKDLAVWPYTKTSKGVLYCINNSHVVLGHLVYLDIQWCLDALILYMCLVLTQVTPNNRQVPNIWVLEKILNLVVHLTSPAVRTNQQVIWYTCNRRSLFVSLATFRITNFIKPPFHIKAILVHSCLNQLSWSFFVVLWAKMIDDW